MQSISMSGDSMDAGDSGRRRRTLDNIIKFTSIIGAGSHFQGSFSGPDNYVVYGKLTGEFNIDGTLVVMESGHVVGNVHARVVVIAGRVEGDLHISGKLELRTTGEVQGNIYGSRIAMDAGAVHDGELHMEHLSSLTEFEERRIVNDISH